MDRELNEAMTGLGKGIAKLFFMAGKGARKLNQKSYIVSFSVTVIIAAFAYFYNEFTIAQIQKFGLTSVTQKAAYISLLLLPFIFLVIVGGLSEANEQKFRKAFESIGFKSRQGKPPLLMKDYKDKLNQRIYLFRSDINLNQWENSKNDLETAFDCTITGISNTHSKKIVQIITIPSSFRLPGDKSGDGPLYWSDEYLSDKEGEIVLGTSFKGTVKINLNKSPHLLAAGETGSGKSVVLRCCLWQLIKQDAKIVMIDFKGGVEFGIDYEQYGEVIMDRKRAAEVLREIVEENDRRLKMFRQARVKNLPEYNKKFNENLCRIGILCDEIGEMLDKKGKAKEEKAIYEELESYISSIARLGRAAGINLLLGIQRPDANIITGQIKSNVPVRICGRFKDKVSSEIVLGSSAATYLPNVNGRFVFSMGNEMLQMQSYLFEDEKVLNPMENVAEGSETKAGRKEKKKKQVKKEKEETPFYALPPVYVRDEEEGESGYEYQGLNFNYEDEGEIKWSVDHEGKN